MIWIYLPEDWAKDLPALEFNAPEPEPLTSVHFWAEKGYFARKHAAYNYESPQILEAIFIAEILTDRIQNTLRNMCHDPIEDGGEIYEDDCPPNLRRKILEYWEEPEKVIAECWEMIERGLIDFQPGFPYPSYDDLKGKY